MMLLSDMYHHNDDDDTTQRELLSAHDVENSNALLET